MRVEASVGGIVQEAESLTAMRHRMVEEQIAAGGVRTERVIEAMRRVPRERFLKEALEEFAYQDTPLPIESDQNPEVPGT